MIIFGFVVTSRAEEPTNIFVGVQKELQKLELNLEKEIQKIDLQEKAMLQKHIDVCNVVRFRTKHIL